MAMSTAEAEYIAAAAAVKEALWFRKLGDDLQQAWGSSGGAVQLLTDNQAALALLHQSSSSGSARAKHIDVAYHFSRERVERGEVCFAYCPTGEMVADCLTKSLSKELLVRCRVGMGM